MRKLLVGDCVEQNKYAVVDPTEPLETEFEWHVVKAISCLFPDYSCILFGGSFAHESEPKRPDLALVAKDFSHWFVIEVELASHSLDGHVLPQVRAFRFGEPQDDCVSAMARGLRIASSQAATLVRMVPFSVVVVANVFQRDWDLALRALDAQLLTLTIFRSHTGVTAYQMDGQIAVIKESIGFGTYSAVDQAIRFPASPKLQDGSLQIEDVDGSTGLWASLSKSQLTWITKVKGVPQLADGSQVQLIRSHDGRLVLRVPKVVTLRKRKVTS